MKTCQGVGAARLGCAVLLLLAAQVARPAEPRIGHFTQYDAGDFVIVTSRIPVSTA